MAGGGKTGAWSSRINDKSQWIQVDLRVKFQVTKIATQGRQDLAQWVTQYKVFHHLHAKATLVSVCDWFKNIIHGQADQLLAADWR